MAELNFRQKVLEIVAQIPKGRVMTYGQIAALAGSPRAARIVGGIAHYGDSKFPWHRVVNKTGGLASGYPGGRAAHAKHLGNENVVINSHNKIYKLDINEYIWWP